MTTHRRLTAAITLLGLLAIAGCGAPCEDSLGVYPPDHIVVTGAEAVEVPHLSWTCGDFNSDSIDPPPSMAPDGEQRLRVDVTLERGTTVEVRFGNQEVLIEPIPIEGPNSWEFQAPGRSEPLIVRLCSSDERCALYWLNTYSIPD